MLVTLNHQGARKERRVAQHRYMTDLFCKENRASTYFFNGGSVVTYLGTPERHVDMELELLIRNF